jgi:hypothetical protein
MLAVMDEIFRYRGRALSTADVVFIRTLIAAHPEASRRALSQTLCRRWAWKQPNGQLRDMLCRSMMLALHRAGHIELPPVRCQPPNNVIARRAPAAVAVDRQPIRGRLGDLMPLDIRAVRATPDEPLFNALVEAHHYLGYTAPVGEQLKYIVFAQQRPIACFAWSSAARHLGPRDRFIGWSATARRRNIGLIAYNTRFLVLPWVEVANLASHLLGRLARQVPRDWQRVYGHPVHYLETFIDPGRFRGTCYRAANWMFLGPTTGRGHRDWTHQANRPPKEVLGLALTPRFRALLSRGG